MTGAGVTSGSRRRGWRWVVVVPVVVLLSACGGGQAASSAPSDGSNGGFGQPASRFSGTLLDPPNGPPVQTLTDTEGRSYSLADQPADEVTVLFFGYTHCPDVCPTTMADLVSARQQLPEHLQERVTVVFVSEDPERDTPADVRRWVDRFHPSFVGLMGGNKTTEQMLAQLHLPETKRIEEPEEPVDHPHTGQSHHQHDDYAVEHAGVVYAFGPGDRTLIYTGGTGPTEYAEDFEQLLSGAE